MHCLGVFIVVLQELLLLQCEYFGASGHTVMSDIEGHVYMTHWHNNQPTKLGTHMHMVFSEHTK